jgi:hypothetical protein
MDVRKTLYQNGMDVATKYLTPVAEESPADERALQPEP